MTARFWQWLNRTARSQYRWMLSRHPVAARRLKQHLMPILLRGNKMFLNKDFIPLFTDPAPDDLIHRFQGPLPADYRPLVSVIVPNYNHAPYLRQRLESIVAQSYGRIEVILLDDASTDESRAILQEFADRHGAQLIENAQNSGSPFRQWQQGIAAAKGDLIWIAESDDWADPAFLERLVPYFRNPAVTLAFGRSVFMDQSGTAPVAAMEDQVAPLDPAIYASAFIEPGFSMVQRGFGLVNLIPNVGGALFRRPRLKVTEPEIWGSLRVCGDWVLYLQLLRGAMLAYDPGAISYYRIHGANSSVIARRDDAFYAEHEVVAACVARHFGMTPARLAELRDRLAQIWRGARRDAVSGLDALFCPERILTEPARPRILIAGAGFFPGGAEIFAITLANLLRAEGASVTFLDCGQDPEEPGVRSRLDSDIAILTDPTALPDICAAFGVQIVHSHHAWVDQTILADAPADVAKVVTLHGMYETLPAADRKRLLGYVDARATAITATALRNMSGLPEGRAVLIANAVAVGRVVPKSRATLAVPDDAFLIVTVSRAVPEKGWPEAISAVEQARSESGRDIHLVLAGTGPVFDVLQRQSLPPYIHLAGFCSNPAGLFAAADLALLPSRNRGESAPLSVIEALSAGTPVLASDLGEVANMLARDGAHAGETFALNDWQIDTRVLAARIVRLATDPVRMGQLRAAIPRVLDDDAPQRMAHAFLAVYRQAVERQTDTA